MPRYQITLADGLKKRAGLLTARRRFPEAETAYKDRIAILEPLAQRFDDRPTYGAALIETWERLAEFYQGNKGDKPDEVAQQQARLRCLDQGMEVGRKLAKKFPGNPDTQFQLGEILFQRANYDSSADRNKEAFPFYQECAELLRAPALSKGFKPSTYQLRRILVWMDYAQTCAESLKRTDEVMRLAQLADDLAKGSTDREVISTLGALVSRSANVHKVASRWPEAIKAYSRALEIRKPAFEKDPWHWFLHSNVAGDLKMLAECYEKTGDFRGEAQAWREYLKIWSGPMNGMKVDYYVDSARPSDEPEAARLRQFAKSTPETQYFYYNYDLGGVNYPLTVRITNVPWPKDPLEDQARCLQETNGGTIPTDIRESFRRLHKYAYENNVSFIEHCKNVIRANVRPDSEKEELKKTKARLTAHIATLTQARAKISELETQRAARERL